MNEDPMAVIERLTGHTSACNVGDPRRYECGHDLARSDLREILMAPGDDLDDPQSSALVVRQLQHAVAALSLDVRVSELSALRLAYSLCPMHHGDYAICFDDENPECAAIRAVFPAYDS